MAIMNYNGVVIPYCESVRFGHKADYDESDTDVVGMDIDIEIKGYIHLEYLGHILDLNRMNGKRLDGPASLYQNRNVAGIIQIIRSRLLQPRRELHFWVNGIDMIPQTHRRRSDATTGYTRFIARPPFVEYVTVPPTGTPVANPELARPGDFDTAYPNLGFVDSKNGPKPQSCDIVKLTDTMFMVSFRIKANYYESRKDSNILNTLGHEVISNRWNETVVLDELQYTTRTRNGKFIIRSDNYEKFISDADRAGGRAAIPQGYLRQLAALAVPAGFVRIGSNYRLSPDGLGMEYTVTDKEIYKLPPQGALKASGEYSEKVGVCGVVRHGSASVTLEAGKAIRQSVLLFKAIALVITKLGLRGYAPGGSESYLEGMNYSIDMFENKVSVSARARIPPIDATGEFRYTNTIEEKFYTFTPLVDRIFGIDGRLPAGTSVAPPITPTWPSSAYNIMGSSNLLMRAAAYWDPALRRVAIPPNRSELYGTNDAGVTDRRPIPGETSVESQLFTF